MENKCQYNFQWHMKPTTKQWSIETCMREKMGTMSDPVQCTKYFSGIADEECSISDIQKICESNVVKSFQVDDARSLCEVEWSAQSTWWQQKKMSMFINQN